MSKICYLASRYPALSHTFILREVQGLRARGLEIATASVNPPDRPVKDLTAAERSEARRTFVIKATSPLGVLLSHAAVLLTSPFRYVRTLGFALQLAGWDLRQALRHLFYLAEAVLVGRWVSRQGSNRLHVHFLTPAATVGLLAHKLFGLRLSYTVHGPDEFDNVERHCIREKVMAAEMICCIGSFARSQLMKLVPADQWSKLRIAPLGVDPTTFAPLQEPRGEEFQILCVGRLVPQKGQHSLLECIAALRREGLPMQLRFVGDGPDRASLERRAAELDVSHFVVFEGGVNQDRIRDLYAQADCFVLPSFAEGIPVVLMEAMAMGIPCVSTKINGIPELIRDGVDGFLVAPSDQEALALTLRNLWRNPDLRRRIGAAGRERVLSHYNLETNLDRLAAIFRHEATDRAQTDDSRKFPWKRMSLSSPQS